jgi:hypothetical protein
MTGIVSTWMTPRTSTRTPTPGLDGLEQLTNQLVDQAKTGGLQPAPRSPVMSPLAVRARWTPKAPPSAEP